jgi:hypothetical protein
MTGDACGGHSEADMTKWPLAGVLLAVVLGVSLVAGAQDQPTFRVETRVVEVDVVVTDPQGRFVRDLTGDDFEILEDGMGMKRGTVSRGPGTEVGSVLVQQARAQVAPESHKLDIAHGHTFGHIGPKMAVSGSTESPQVVEGTGAGDGDRTRDIELGKLAFYR